MSDSVTDFPQQYLDFGSGRIFLQDPLVPPECVFVAESGVSSVAQIAILADARVDAVLIGEALLRDPDPGARLRELVAAGAPRGVRA